jgi:hypothetical protein
MGFFRFWPRLNAAHAIVEFDKKKMNTLADHKQIEKLNIMPNLRQSLHVYELDSLQISWIRFILINTTTFMRHARSGGPWPATKDRPVGYNNSESAQEISYINIYSCSENSLH